MRDKQDLQSLIATLKEDEHIAHWHEQPEKEAKYAPFPSTLNETLAHTLGKRGIGALYTHQRLAYDEVEAGKNIVTVTPTASGKTLCYNLPVLNAITEDPEARAIYLFPTKALAQDQKSEMAEWIEAADLNVNSYTYDGDTAPAIRQKIRHAGHIVMTNPDMLHTSILPHHTKWVSLFEKLRFIVIDELHTYRGVFGSHVANVIRRLLRLANYYGSDPQFITTSATIRNPKELAEQLTGCSFSLIDNNGAPQGKKHLVLYNPPVVNQSLNVRRNASKEVRTLAKRFLEADAQIIVFARSRVRVEVIYSDLQTLIKDDYGPASIRAYRGGYLPNERRAIERGLREGDIRGVVSTNALELGMDIGQLQVCLLTGYPGSVSSLWQQAGRAGRRQEESLVMMVAGSTPIDQYVMQHPDYILSSPVEEARIEPNNLIILIDHLKCAAYELPFKVDDTFGGLDISDMMNYLAEERVVHRRKETWYWMSQAFPAHDVSLRSASQENIVIVDTTITGSAKVIGEMDRFSAMTLLHEEAIYLHQGQQYQVETLDWEEKKAYVRLVEVEYFTDASLNVKLTVIEQDESQHREHHHVAFGDVAVTIMPSIFKKIKLSTYENIGSGPIHLPQEEIHTAGTWVDFDETWLQTFGEQRFERMLVSFSQVVHHLGAVLTMSDKSDLHVAVQIKADHSQMPAIFIYDHYPGGIGLASQLYKRMDELIERSAKLIHDCPCSDGCPVCIGTGEQSGLKNDVQRWLSSLAEKQTGNV
ncbi:DEAD/DEAH box helicase [Natribacillus halophilus]|uniref:DEAD/DEAH box helicase domain-containing protein n=1 Tax=Natribacillus halophilus TaxID=549003 RepID=A0A1G8J692_9BACI|nr:DEAD/DEAH box helicase [Natribacillus halophilus]SDI26769.1 DEAD/DEAH box helicase domain-containing protein [Natribacillus halophilus]